MEDMIDIHELDLEKLEMSCSFLILGPPGVGKTTLIKNILFKVKHKYPICRAVCSVPGPNRTYCSMIPPLFVFSEFDIEREKEFIKRQKELANDPNSKDEKYSIVIYDDVDNCSNKQIINNFFSDLYKRGSRHYNCLILNVNQYAFDYHPDVRSSATYIAIFRYNSNDDLDKLYTNFAPKNIFGDKKKFIEIFNKLTGNYSCMVIKKNAISNDIRDCVFFYQCIDIKKKFKVGSAQLKTWNRKYCDPTKKNYI